MVLTNEKSNEGELKHINYEKIEPNPYNPRELFDREKMDILKESIKNVGVLVPLLVYRRNKDGKIIILDGERRLRCVKELVKEYHKNKAKWENLPANIIPEPDMVSNILRMFNIHNVRESWELMPTALKLELLMKELKERSDHKLSELTGLSAVNVRRCKILLTYDKEFQDEMLNLDPEKRVKADFFLELYPVLSLIQKNLRVVYSKYTRKGLINRFLEKYKNKEISSVLQFREIADSIRSMKKGKIECKSCEEMILRLLDTNSKVKDVITKTYHATKIVEGIEKNIEITMRNVVNFKPNSFKERDDIKKLLELLSAIIKKKIEELEKFDAE